MEAKQVTLKGKTYTIRNGVIYIIWESIVPSTANSIRPQYTQRRSVIDPSGKLGRQILAIANAAV